FDDSSPGALLVESRPLNPWTWRASSKDHLIAAPHSLRTYAIGLRLDGVSTATLRRQIFVTSDGTPGQQAWPAFSLGIGGPWMLSGGASAASPGAGQLLTKSYPDGPNSWGVQSKDHLVSSPGSIIDYVIWTSSIIEGFGMLERQMKSG